MTAPDSIADRLHAFLEAPEAPPRGARVTVAVSGGLDSTVLLHLLRFERPHHFDLTAAHFDHAIRPDSAADACWVRGLCTAWGVPLTMERARSPLRSEAEARAARYDFLERTRLESGAAAILTAHHADDQAETVLFRVLRGTGPSGLAGIPRRRDGVVYRPLLECWRAELADYARWTGVRWREDPSNAEHGFARNAIRHRILPEAEHLVAPGARRALVRLARLSCADEAAWSAALERILAELDVERAPDATSIDRDRLLELAPALRARVLRSLVGRYGVTLDERGTRSAVEFSSSGPSGRGIELGAGVELRRRLGRLVVERPARACEDRTLTIPDVGPGGGEVRLGGRCLRVRWGVEAPPDAGLEWLDVSRDRLPLEVRGRQPGDRIRLHGGTKKLKKLLLDARVPDDRRERIAVVVDSGGEVVWVPGIARSVVVGSGGVEETLKIGIG